MHYKFLSSLIGSVFLCTLIYSCKNDYSKKQHAIDYISAEYEQIIRLSNLEDFKSQLNTQPLLITLQNEVLLNRFPTLLTSFKAIEKNGDALLAFDTQHKHNFLLVADTSDLSVNFKTLEQFVSDSLILVNNQQINKIQLTEQVVYFTTRLSHFLLSNDKNSLITAINDKKANHKLLKDFSVVDNTKEASIINYDRAFLTPVFCKISTDTVVDSFSEFSVIDFSFNSNSILFSGVTATNDSLDLLRLFHKTIPQTNEAVNLFPANFDNFTSLTISDYHNFEMRLSPQLKDSLPDFIRLAVEAALYEKDAQQAIALRFLDDNLVKDKLLELDKIETFRDVDIYPFNLKTIFRSSYDPFISMNEVAYVFKINKFHVFTENIALAKQLIVNYSNNNTIAQSAPFLNIADHLSNESSLLILKNNKSFNTTMAQLLGTKNALSAKDYNLNAIQLIYEDSFAHINGVFSSQNGKKSNKNVEELFTVSFENDIVNVPQFVSNHLNKEKDIVVQDVNNNLYLLSNTGTIYWNKKLEHPIIGGISQIDTYKNGRLQLVFATKNKLYMLDRNGNDVAGFPLNFKDDITQPLSVFDYDNNKNYRLLLTQGNTLLMLDKTGKNVTGFKPDLINTKITKQPQHFRIGSKDYIVFAQDKTMKILDRTGATRIAVKELVNFSENNIYLNNNKFTTITADGQILTVDSRGVVSTTGKISSQKTQLDAGSKSLVTFSENKLTINNQVIELDFGTYDAPKLFYLNDKIYVAITDLQTNKAYLFDSQGQAIDSFPVYGNSTLILDNIDKNSDLEAVTKGSNKSLIFYQIQ